jgi:sugar phosphate isomerase/epimerase
MKLQRIDEVREKIKNDFEKLKAEHPEKVRRPIDLSFSTWVFGMETLEESVARLAKCKVPYIELGGNYGGKDTGYQSDIEKVKEILNKYGVKVSGICGFYGDENALSTASNFTRQTAKDYIRNEVKFCKAVGGQYLLVVPGTVGRSHPYDQSDYERSVETLRSVADVFVGEGVKCAVEPINSAEVPICSTVASVQKYIKDVNHSGVQYINGDTFHMLCGEPNVPLAILQASSQLLNLHLSDTNRAPVGRGMIDVDTVIRALYLIGFNTPGHFATGEPIGEGRESYSITYGRYPESFKEKLVSDTVDYFRERESEIAGFN